MATWGELARARPDLVEAGAELMYQHGVGLGFLATVRRDGAPRVNPVCPLLTDDGLFAFIIPSPKRDDLRRDGRYALHSFPCPDNEDAFSVRGQAHAVHDDDLRARLERQFLGERSQLPLSVDDLRPQTLFELDIAGCLLTRTEGHGDPSPRHTVWREADTP